MFRDTGLPATGLRCGCNAPVLFHCEKPFLHQIRCSLNMQISKYANLQINSVYPAGHLHICISLNLHITYFRSKLEKMKELILEAWANRELLKEEKYTDAVKSVIEEVDKGRLRAAAPD